MKRIRHSTQRNKEAVAGMKSSRINGSPRRKNRITRNVPPEKYVLRLYITGVTARSTRAILNLKALCNKHMPGRFQLDVIDIYQQPELARGEQIVAAPTLVKTLPLPLRRFIGDMSRPESLVLALGLSPAQQDSTANDDQDHKVDDTPPL